ncbi:NnrS protein [compost metagenome]
MALRVLPELGLLPAPPGPPHALAALFWAAAFLLWLKVYWPFLSRPRVEEAAVC